jgi:hypothetical protein
MLITVITMTESRYAQQSSSPGDDGLSDVGKVGLAEAPGLLPRGVDVGVTAEKRLEGTRLHPPQLTGGKTG